MAECRMNAVLPRKQADRGRIFIEPRRICLMDRAFFSRQSTFGIPPTPGWTRRGRCVSVADSRT
jgi:hypothetical protein